MITISSAIHQKIQDNPFIVDGLRQNIINISELARLWHAEIENITRKQVTIEALAMAIRRSMRSTLKQSEVALHPITPLQCTMRSDLIERSFTKSTTILRACKRLTETLDFNADIFITWSMGVHEVTIVADRKLETLINAACKEEESTASLNDLSAIILKLPEEVISTPGSYYNFLGKLTWQGINIEEVISTAHELIIIVKTQIAHEAFKHVTS